jgi:GNAT superfamily N-acetyltransferase
MPLARLAQRADLASMLELFRVAEVSLSAEPIERAERIWLEMLSHEGVAVFVSAIDAGIVSTCMLITAPNLLRAGGRHGFLENVVTHPEFRGRGHGRAVVDVQEALGAPPAESPVTPVLPMHFRKGATELKLFTTIATLGTPQDITVQERRVECFFPMDEKTAGILRGWCAEALRS